MWTKGMVLVYCVIGSLLTFMGLAVLGVISIFAAWEEARIMRGLVREQSVVIARTQQVIEAKQSDQDEIMVQFDRQFLNISIVLGKMNTWQPIVGGHLIYGKPYKNPKKTD